MARNVDTNAQRLVGAPRRVPLLSPPRRGQVLGNLGVNVLTAAEGKEEARGLQWDLQDLQGSIGPGFFP